MYKNQKTLSSSFSLSNLSSTTTNNNQYSVKLAAAIPVGTDKEAEEIYKLALKYGVSVFVPTVHGTVVNTRTAYNADGLVPHKVMKFDDSDDEKHNFVKFYDKVIKIECDGPIFDHVRDKVITVDHHRPGDPGYETPPSEYWLGSSIGQFVQVLGKYREEYMAEDFLYVETVDNNKFWFPKPHNGHLLYIAAADHNLYAAYAGLCPGIIPANMLMFRLNQKAQFTGKSLEELVKQFINAMDIIMKHYDKTKGYSDLTKLGPVQIPELNEAAAYMNAPFMAQLIDKDGKLKVVFQGANEELIVKFMNKELVPGLVKTYGSPKRGYAGGYYEEGEEE